jgi:hypothetical protein
MFKRGVGGGVGVGAGVGALKPSGHVYVSQNQPHGQEGAQRCITQAPAPIHTGKDTHAHLYTHSSPKHTHLDHPHPTPQHSTDAPLPLDYGPWLSMTPEGRDFVFRCLSRDWSQRLTAEQALYHPWCALAVAWGSLGR